MCLAVPMRVFSIQGDAAVVESGGVVYQASARLTPGVKAGDYVLLHTGYIISVVDQEEAEQTLALFRQIKGLVE